RDADDLTERGLPVTATLLPGPPLEHQGLLTRGWLDVRTQLFRPTQYWLVLLHTEPILRVPVRGFCVADHLLMETDRANFPRPENLFGHLCIIKSGPSGALKLA